MSFYIMVMVGGQAIGGIVMGWIAEHLGTTVAFVVAGSRARAGRRRRSAVILAQPAPAAHRGQPAHAPAGAHREAQPVASRLRIRLGASLARTRSVCVEQALDLVDPEHRHRLRADRVHDVFLHLVDEAAEHPHRVIDDLGASGSRCRAAASGRSRVR